MDKIEVTQADRDFAADYLFRIGTISERSAKDIKAGDWDETRHVLDVARHRLATRTDATPVAEAWAGMEAAMQDPDYAWGWHCNLAMPIMDATGITHEQANMAAAHLMQHLWNCDITTHPHYQYVKSGAQSYAEFRIEVDEAEDALPAAPDATYTHPPATDVAALVEAAKDLRDAIAHMAAPARVDPDKYFSEQVKAFGDAFGYGALMTTASALWRQSLGDLQGGEFAVGPCVTTAANQLNRLSAALAPFTKGQNDDG